MSRVGGDDVAYPRHRDHERDHGRHPVLPRRDRLLRTSQVCAFLEANGHDSALFEEYKVDGAALMAMTDADVRNLTGMQPHTLDRLRSDMRRSFADYREGAGADGAARPPTPAPTVITWRSLSR